MVPGSPAAQLASELYTFLPGPSSSCRSTCERDLYQVKREEFIARVSPVNANLCGFGLPGSADGFLSCGQGNSPARERQLLSLGVPASFRSSQAPCPTITSSMFIRGCSRTSENQSIHAKTITISFVALNPALPQTNFAVSVQALPN